MIEPWILGISASHNGAFCLLQGKEVRVAIQEERLTGLKRDRVYGGRSALGLQYCLETAGISASDLSMVVVSCQRSAKAEENNIWLHPGLSGLTQVSRHYVSHHLAHAASAFATSGYDRAAVMIVDGLGSPIEDLDESTKRVVIDSHEANSEHLSLFRACGTQLTPLEVHASHRWLANDTDGMSAFASIGGMYSAVAQQIFGELMDAGKVMGLAPYGRPTIPTEEFIHFDGVRLHFPNLVQHRFRYKDRWPAKKEIYQDLAASVQQALEVTLLGIARRLFNTTKERNLCLAGGVALNSVCNELLSREAGFEQLYIVPAAEDSGCAIGAAYLGLWKYRSDWEPRQLRKDSFGRQPADSEVEDAIRRVPQVTAHKSANLVDEVAGRLSSGQIGGWYQGGSELGPRALGQRSIICSPGMQGAKEMLNTRVKFRESFRPFAPAVLAEKATEWFDFGTSDEESRFMLRVVRFRPERRALVPAVVHIDGTGRVQTVTDEDGTFYELIQRFHVLTGIPMLLNTSMNVRGEPIAETPEDALWCLLGTGLDFCVINDWVITKVSNFHDVLNYVPEIVADEWTIRLGVTDNTLCKTIEQEDAVVFRVSTPWGKANTVLPLRLLPLVSNIDGKSTGRAIAARLSNAQPLSVLHDLLLLRRMHIAKLREPHVSHD